MTSERLKHLQHYVFREQASRVVGFITGREKNVNYEQIVDRIVIDENWIPVHQSTVQRASSRWPESEQCEPFAFNSSRCYQKLQRKTTYLTMKKDVAGRPFYIDFGEWTRKGGRVASLPEWMAPERVRRKRASVVLIISRELVLFPSSPSARLLNKHFDLCAMLPFPR